MDYANIQAYTPTEETDSDSDNRSTNMVRTYTISMDYDLCVHGNVAKQTGQHISIIDGGADSMILGAGWLFDNIHPTKTVNIIGFDEKHAMRRGCSIGTAYAVITGKDGKPYLAVIHHAVQNEGSRTSLLSEAQMRHHGVIVDCTPSQFLGIDHKPGTQSLQVPYNGNEPTLQYLAHIHLTVRAALMTCTHRFPTDFEVNTLPRLQLTSQATWDPHAF